MSAHPVSRSAALALAQAAQRQRTASLRTLLGVGSVTVIAAALLLGTPSEIFLADAELAGLMRGIAAVKALIVVAAVGLLHWRFGQRLSARLASAYLVGTWLIAGASAMIWQLAEIPTAAFSFHLGAFVLLATAWRDLASEIGIDLQDHDQP